jgi:DNA mismatch repair ATPase MutS
MSKLKEFYQSKIAQFAQKLDSLQSRLNQLSVTRTACFLGSLILLFIYFYYDLGAFVLFFALIFLILFFRLVKKYDDTKDAIDFTEKLKEINENELNLLNNKHSILDAGERFKTNDGFLNDLDVFGRGSLYHQINRAATQIGLENLAELFKNPFLENQKIIHNQLIVSELNDKIEFRQNLLANNLLIESKKDSIKELLTTIGSYQYQFQKPIWNILRWLWAVLAVAVIGLSIAIGEYKLIFLFIVIGLGIVGIIQKKIQAIHTLVSGQRQILERYTNALQIIENEQFTHPELKKTKGISSNGLIALKELNNIGRLFDQRLNALVSTLSNGLFLYDIHLVLAIEKWMKKYQTEVKNWFDGIAQIETYNSLATYRFNHPEFTFPQPSDNKIYIKSESMGHPLLPDNQRVMNDILLGNPQRMFLVTGSNMSGKSTFLRTLGVNLLLAQMGSVVCAKKFVFSPMVLLTSLHQADSLQENTSYFFAELKKLKTITEQVEGGTVALVLLDEILRGTNSDDKRYGTQKVIEKLMNFDCLTLIATHDLELGKMQSEDPETIENLCFESQIEGNELHFDYKLRKGVAQNKNATFLLKKMGIIETK